MNTKDLVRRCRAIKLNEEEEDLVVLKESEKEKGEQMRAHCLMGKVLSTKSINREAFKRAITQIWRTIYGVKTENLGNNVFIFQFASIADKRRVIQMGPWHFDKALIVLTEPAGMGDITNQNFNFVFFWVQIHNIPVVCMTKEMARKLGGKIGNVEEVDGGRDGDCLGKFLRVRVNIDINKPLRKYIQVQHLNSQDQSTLPLVYERLLKFYFKCGRLGHDFRECDRTNQINTGTQNVDEMAYRHWMRASALQDKGRSSNPKEKGKEERIT